MELIKAFKTSKGIFLSEEEANKIENRSTYEVYNRIGKYVEYVEYEVVQMIFVLRIYSNENGEPLYFELNKVEIK